MVHGKATGGLCERCGHAPYCFYLACQGSVPSCELFDDVGRSTAREAPRLARPRAVPPAGVPPREEPLKLKGLCVNCEHRVTCVHAQRTGGVWHCENYE